MKIRKAIIPAAGLGTRVLPASKSIPKEMLNIVDKPAIQYIVEEAVQAGIEEILIITNRGKGAIEDHFDHSFELEANLRDNPSKKRIYDDIMKPVHMANIYFLRQKETNGLADAIAKTRHFIGNEPFAILYGERTPAVSPLSASSATHLKNTAKALSASKKFRARTSASIVRLT